MTTLRAPMALVDTNVSYSLRLDEAAGRLRLAFKAATEAIRKPYSDFPEARRAHQQKQGLRQTASTQALGLGNT